MNVPMKPTLVGTLAAKYSMDPDMFYKTVKATVMPGNATMEQTAAMLMVAHEYGLNPLLKQIYAFPGKGGGITPMISIDGWCELLNRQPQYDGVHFEDHIEQETSNVYAITCTMWRKDRTHPTVVTEYLDECKRATDPWRQSPKRMLRHRALIQAARYSFGLSGAFDPDHAEIEIAGNVVDVNYEPIERAITPVAPPAKRTAPSPKAKGKELPPETPTWEAKPDGVIVSVPGLKPEPDRRGPIERELDGATPAQFLEELDAALASATTRDELDTIYNDYDVEDRFERDPASLDKAQDNYLWHVKRIDG